MSNSKKRVRAVVRVTMDIEADSVWGGDCNWDQIAKQAEDEVRGLLTSGNPLRLPGIPRRIKSLEVVQVIVSSEGEQQS